ncbi:beta-ketoacyl synthase N-terminal-like domain-containing protein [Desulfoscipio sp. XC116]|uniref:beta-ketoacyl synthase N-terminal-like domain-containing protein n=1 Tax=Desulfoscipio sp. XC116 TaxID=3144975 RepID=UPI00325A92DB
MDDTKIAVIGLAGRYSNAEDIGIMWQKLLDGTDFHVWGEYRRDNLAALYINRYAKIDYLEYFDNEFFHFTPYEAQITDPQQRILLECCFETLENAGYADISKKQCIGVFASASLSTYLLHNILSQKKYNSNEINYNVLISNDKDFTATRIAYKLNLCGPAYTVQSACSSSLVALHCAYQSILNYECDAALVGAVSILIPQEQGYYYKEGGILSKDGICRPFDDEANGTIKGNGCSVVMLKRLAEAEKDQDRIYAVISSTAVNNDGSAKIGFTAPSVEGQAAVIDECIAYSKIDKSKIDYIEAHGTGTKLGDPIEIKALYKVYSNVDKKIPIGSIKANIGHLDVASGLTSTIKAICMLQAGIIPANINFKSLNKEITSKVPFYFPVTNKKKLLTHIGVSSFGLGGTNAHVIVSKYEKKQRPKSQHDMYMIPISYFRESDLEPITKQLIANLNHHLGDIVYSMSIGKRKFKNNVYLLFRNKEELSAKLMGKDYIRSSRYRPSLPVFGLEDYRSFQYLFPKYEELCKTAGIDNVSIDKQQEYFSRHLAWIRFLKSICMLDAEDLTFVKRLDQQLWDLADNDESFLAMSCYDEFFSSIPVGIETALTEFLNFIGQVQCISQIDFKVLYKDLGWEHLAITKYPYKKKRFWIDVYEKAKNVAQIEHLTSRDEDAYVEMILEIWKGVIGLEEVEVDDDFYELGGDSLLLIAVLDKINNRISTKLSIENVINFNTPRKLAGYLSNRIAISNNYTFISKIRDNGPSAQNIFLIHPAGGTTHCYKLLHKYLDTQVEFNLYCIDLPQNHSNYPTMESLAKLYAAGILNIQSVGRVIIGGYSFGGNMACEVALQIQNQNKGIVIDHVLLFDSHPPIAYNSYQNQIINYNKVFFVMLANYLQLDANYIAEGYQKGTLQDELMLSLKNNKKLGLSLSDEEMIGFFDRWVYSHKLLKQHQFNVKLPMDCVIFRSIENEDEFILNTLQIKLYQKQEWEKYFDGNVKIFDTPGNHYTMFSDSENVKELANVVKECYMQLF